MNIPKSNCNELISYKVHPVQPTYLAYTGVFEIKLKFYYLINWYNISINLI